MPARSQAAPLVLLVPTVAELQPVDSRLIRLAEFFGIPWERLPLDGEAPPSPDYLDRAIKESNSCFVVNPQVIGRWFFNESSSATLGNYLVSRFPFILVYNLNSDSASANVVKSLSNGQLHSVCLPEGTGLRYSITNQCREICGPFSGQIFGPVNPVTDRILIQSSGAGAAQELVTIDGHPQFANLSRGRAQVFFLATGEIADMDAPTDDVWLLSWFSRVVLPVMFFRHAFGDACWHPHHAYATLIIDDPYLRRDYGFLNYHRLLRMMDEHVFHTSIAFIPYNCKRSSPAITRIFRERTDRYSLCMHGNDHTSSEFGTTDLSELNSRIGTALKRMDMHQQRTGIPYDKVFVFPQGKFSVNALMALKANNLLAAVNSDPYPQEGASPLTVADFLQPAVTSYGGVPLFLRQYVGEMLPEHVALALFFGKPVLIVEHHSVFQNPERVAELVSRINTIAPDIRWSNLQTAIEHSYLRRSTEEGVHKVMAYARSGKVDNVFQNPIRCSVVKQEMGLIALEEVLLNEEACADVVVNDGKIHFSFSVPPKSSRVFSLKYRNEIESSYRHPGWRDELKVFARRRLSEVRDNYLSKSPALLAVAQALRRTVGR